MDYNESLDYIYQSFMEIKPTIYGKFDREIRNPNIILSIAKSMGVIPSENNIIKVTGSKGKGTVTRLIGVHLQHSGLKNIGMLVSPEELEHYDRIRINSVSMTEEEFVTTLALISPYIENKKKILSGSEYLSPSGIFLLIGLYWFKQNGVEHFVLECGRGAAYDEVGRIKSIISVVTSILYEHPSYLGPTIDDIARDKLAISESSYQVLLGPSAKDKSDSLGIRIKKIDWRPSDLLDLDVPKWYALDEQLAVTASKSYLSTHNLVFNTEPLPVESASFGKAHLGNLKLYYEALISKGSFDDAFIDNLIRQYNKILFIASLPDDKDLVPIHEYLSQKGEVIKHVTLTGTRGYLHYSDTEKLFPNSIIGRIAYNDVEPFRKSIESAIKSSQPTCIYFLGTQTFIRLVKKTFF